MLPLGIPLHSFKSGAWLRTRGNRGYKADLSRTPHALGTALEEHSRTIVGPSNITFVHVQKHRHCILQ